MAFPLAAIPLLAGGILNGYNAYRQEKAQSQAAQDEADAVADEIAALQGLKLDTQAQYEQAQALIEQIYSKAGDDIKSAIELKMSGEQKAALQGLKDVMSQKRVQEVQTGLAGSGSAQENTRNLLKQAEASSVERTKEGAKAIESSLANLGQQKSAAKGAAQEKMFGDLQTLKTQEIGLNTQKKLLQNRAGQKPSILNAIATGLSGGGAAGLGQIASAYMPVQKTQQEIDAEKAAKSKAATPK